LNFQISPEEDADIEIIDKATVECTYNSLIAEVNERLIGYVAIPTGISVRWRMWAGTVWS